MIQPTPEQGELGLRAMHAVALADGRVVEAERALLSAAKTLTGAECDVDALAPIEPEELAAGLDGDPLRQQLVCALVVTAMIDGRATPEELALVRSYASALEVDEGVIGDLRKVGRGQISQARFDLVRRFWGKDDALSEIREAGLVNTIRALQRRREDPDKARRYRALGELPEGTLGRAYFEFVQGHDFSFPGEPGHGAEKIALHDMAHVLGGYGAEPADEILVGYFTAGFRRERPITFVLVTLTQLQLGMHVLPGQSTAADMLQPDQAARALQRGAAMNTDLADGWDPWPVVEVPVAELREKYGIPERA